MGQVKVKMKANCKDCNLPYSEFGMDTTIPNLQWSLINPEGKQGLLCANCMVRRGKRLLSGVIAARMVFEIDPYDEQV